MTPVVFRTTWFKVGWGGGIRIYGRVWTAWPWRRWVKVTRLLTEDEAFYAGSQWTAEEIARFREGSRAPVICSERSRGPLGLD